MNTAKPVIKFAGGKRQLLPKILPLLPAKIRTYYEPFIGGGAVFFALANEHRFERAVLGDANGDLINMYAQLRDDLPSVVRHLRTHAAKNCEDYFYEQRAYPLHRRGPAPAARLIYLLKTCFNGMYRVNKSGELNMPWGKYENPAIVDLPTLKAASFALQGVELIEGDFEKVVAKSKRGDAAYFDPPYLPTSATANFVGYHSDGFDIADTERLAYCYRMAARRGVHVLLSNADVPECRRIFRSPSTKLERVSARRNINSKGDGRGSVSELLISESGQVTAKHPKEARP